MSVQPRSPSPAERVSTPVDGVDVLGALSPSRAGDFLACPLLYRFRTIDRLPEPPSPDAVRGTVVHKVLEDLFDLPAVDRTPARAA
jgi:putative RecB family exonuclease